MSCILVVICMLELLENEELHLLDWTQRIIHSVTLCPSSDLIKHVVKEYRNVYPEIMKRATHTFDQVSSPGRTLSG